MLDQQGFDRWADDFDRATERSDEDNTYPFAGYREVLACVERLVLEKPRPTVLHPGFGTAALTARLHARRPALRRGSHPGPGGAPVPPAIRFYPLYLRFAPPAGGTTSPLPLRLAGPLAARGKLLLGDVAFETRAQLEACRQAAGDDWGAAECCFVAQELKELSPTWFSGRSPSVPAC